MKDIEHSNIIITEYKTKSMGNGITITDEFLLTSSILRESGHVIITYILDFNNIPEACITSDLEEV